MRRYVLTALTALLATLVALYFMLMAAMGDCAPGENCLSDTARDIFFFGSPIAAVLVTVLAYFSLRKTKT